MTHVILISNHESQSQSSREVSGLAEKTLHEIGSCLGQFSNPALLCYIHATFSLAGPMRPYVAIGPLLFIGIA